MLGRDDQSTDTVVDVITEEQLLRGMESLTPTERADDRMSFVRQWAADLPDVTALVNGPWPPYTFSGIDESGGSAPRPPA